MTFRVNSEYLHKALNNVTRIISSRSQLPIAGCVKITTKENTIIFTTTNLESFCIHKVQGKAMSDGECCVPAKLLVECVQSFPQDVVDMELRESALVISCGGYEAELPTMNAMEFPPVPDISQKGIVLEKDALLQSLSLVLFAAAQDEGRPILTGIKFRMDATDGTIAATDGYRLSVKKAHLITHDAIDMVIPSRVLGEVARVATEEKETKTISLVVSDDGQLGMVLGDVTYIMRRLNGEYPPFEKIIPKTHVSRMKILVKDFLKAVKSAAIFARDNANIVKLSLTNGMLTVTANTPSVGKNKIDVPMELVGDESEIAYNARFLIDLLSHVQSEYIIFEMTGSLNPGVFKIDSDDSFLHVIMPVRVQN